MSMALELRSMNSLNGLPVAQSRTGFLRSFLMSDAPDENWKPVLGSVNHEITASGKVRNHKTGKPIKAHITEKGYYRLSLCSEGAVKNVGVHRAVLEAFVGPSDLAVDHIDGDKSNNSLENLRYVTVRQNNHLMFQRQGFKYTGTYYSKKRRKWIAQALVNRVPHYLGGFDTQKEAFEVFMAFMKSIDEPTFADIKTTPTDRKD